MRPKLGILTEDFRLYHDLVAELKSRDVSFVSLSFRDPVPPEVGAVLTSPSEAPKVDFEDVLPVEDVPSTVSRALQVLRGKREWRELVIGIDPGVTPGVAVLGDGDVIHVRDAKNPEAVAELARRAMLSFPAARVRILVGHGDPTNRNRIINALAPLGLPVEIVDEEGTSPRVPSPTPHVDAAVEIARGRGVRAARYYSVEPTEGEIRDIQRQSRIRSSGLVTISKSLARQVARGELTLEDAVRQHRQSTPPTS